LRGVWIPSAAKAAIFFVGGGTAEAVP